MGGVNLLFCLQANSFKTLACTPKRWLYFTPNHKEVIMVPALILALLKALLLLATVAFITLVFLHLMLRKQIRILERLDRYAKR